MSVMSVTGRFLIGGLIVAGVPLLARHLGPHLAGIVVLIPATTALSAYFVARASGAPAVGQLATGGLAGLPALALFLICLYAASRTVPVPAALAVAGVAWTLAVIVTRYGPGWPAVAVLAGVLGFRFLRPARALSVTDSPALDKDRR